MIGRVLVVDDAETTRNVLRAVLRQAGYDVVSAEDGPTALARAAQGGIDLVLLDLVMPGMSGLEVCQRLKQDPATAALPIIVITAVEADATKEMVLATGADDFVAKPLRGEDVRARVDAMLKVRRIQNDLDRTLAYLHELEAARQTQRQRALESIRAATPEGSAPASPPILLVAEERRTREFYAAVLGDHGFTVHAAQSGSEALSLFAQHGAEAAIVAVLMSEMSGFELLARLQRHDPDLPILLTGHPTPQAARAALTGGAFDFLVQGLDPHLVALALRRATRYRRTIREKNAEFREEEHRRQQLEAVRMVSAEIARELALDRLLDLILRRSAELAGAESGRIVLWDENGQMLVPHVQFGPVFAPMPASPIALGEGLAGKVAATRQGLIINNYREWEGARPDALRLTTVTASLAEPLLYRGDLIGVVNLAHGDGKLFTAHHALLLRLFADQAAVAIQNARLFAEVQRERHESTVLASLTRTINASLELDVVLQAVAEGARELCGSDFAEIALRQPGDEVLRLRCVAGRPLPQHLPLTVEHGVGLGGQILATGRPFRTENYARDPRITKEHLARVEALGAVAEMGVPILIDEGIEGIIYVDNCTARPFGDPDEVILTRLAEYAAVAIRNARLYTGLKDAFESQRRLREELVRAEKLRGLGQMAAGIAHDLNNTLAIVLGQAELLQLRVRDTEVLQALRVLSTATMDGAAVVRRLQDFARQRTAVPLTPCDLAPLVEEALQITRPRWRDEAQRRDATIVIETALPPLPPVLGNPPEIREALTNLIFNAVDAMPHGGNLTVGARTMSGPPPGPADALEASQDMLPLGLDAPHRVGPTGAGPAWVELVVTDTGNGIPAEIQGRIFEPFFTTKGVRGTGLGLSVVYGIMERHGGRIDVESADGCGATFRLRFQTATVPASWPSREPALRITTPRRLLLVDDDQMVRQTVAAVLREAGHTVIEADEGAAAMQVMMREPVDLVVTDLGMPGISGWEVAHQAKQRSPALPVILLTGWGEHVRPDGGQEPAADRTLGKPVDFAALLAAINDLAAPRG